MLEALKIARKVDDYVLHCVWDELNKLGIVDELKRGTEPTVIADKFGLDRSLFLSLYNALTQTRLIKAILKGVKKPKLGPEFSKFETGMRMLVRAFFMRMQGKVPDEMEIFDRRFYILSFKSIHVNRAIIRAKAIGLRGLGFKPKNGVKLIELGAGYGSFTLSILSMLARYGVRDFKLICVDMSEDMEKEFYKTVTSEMLTSLNIPEKYLENIEYKIADVSELPKFANDLGKESFDYALSCALQHWVRNRHEMYRGIATLLKPGAIWFDVGSLYTEKVPSLMSVLLLFTRDYAGALTEADLDEIRKHLVVEKVKTRRTKTFTSIHIRAAKPVYLVM